MKKEQIKKEMRGLYEHALKSKSYGGKDTDEFHMIIETADFDNSRMAILFECKEGEYIGFFDGSVCDELSEESGEYYLYFRETKRCYKWIMKIMWGCKNTEDQRNVTVYETLLSMWLKGLL